ncbi:transposase [Umezawaea beigongshangensis]|uniref:transposase n=1 Tax=Umezawaea beigongshangensis TaxID=2780383 RepID=UPI0018F15CE1
MPPAAACPPPTSPCRGGRWKKHCRRVIVDAIFSLVGNGIEWRALSADFPPQQTVDKCFAAREKAGASQRVLDALRERVRLAGERVAACRRSWPRSRCAPRRACVGPRGPGTAGRRSPAASGTS